MTLQFVRVESQMQPRNMGPFGFTARLLSPGPLCVTQNFRTVVPKIGCTAQPGFAHCFGINYLVCTVYTHPLSKQAERYSIAS